MNLEVSVVMGVYNNADTLPSAMQSILRQDDVRLEFIVVDDGSTDGSGAILDDFAATDSRVKVIHKSNEGLTRALIDGCRAATAPWIARQDADDLSLPGRLRKQLDVVHRFVDSVLVTCGARFVSPEGLLLYEHIPESDAERLRQKIFETGQSPSAHGTLMFRRDKYHAVGGYRAAFYFAQDVDLVLRLSEAGSVVCVPEVLYQGSVSLSRISAHSLHEQRRFHELLLEARSNRNQGMSEDGVLDKASRLSEACRNERIRKAAGFDAYYFIGACLLRHYPKEARRYLQQSLRFRPWSVRAWISLAKSFRSCTQENTF